MTFPKKPTLTEEGIGRHVCAVCLYEEEVTLPKLDAAPDLRLTVKNGEYSLYASNGGLSAWVWIGSYKDGRIIDVKRKFIRTTDYPILDLPVSELGLNVTDADEIRAFMFSYNNMIKPLLPVVKLKITAS